MIPIKGGDCRVPAQKYTHIRRRPQRRPRRRPRRALRRHTHATADESVREVRRRGPRLGVLLVGGWPVS
jgi:hypothetical protein